MEEISFEIPAGRAQTRKAGAVLEIAGDRLVRFTVWAHLETDLPQVDLDDWEEDLYLEMRCCFRAQLEGVGEDYLVDSGLWVVSATFTPGVEVDASFAQETLTTRTL